MVRPPHPVAIGPAASRRFRRRLALSVAMGLWIGLGWLAGGPVASARGSADDEAQVRQQIEAYWRAFDNVQLETTEAYDCDDDRRDERKEIRFAWDLDGRSSLFVTRTSPDSIFRSEVRQDRTRSYRVAYFDAPSPAIDRISIQPPWNGPGEYRGERVLGLWALLPGGKTPAKLLADGATLRRGGPFAAHRWSIAGEVQQARFECVLDDQHGYLPTSTTFASPRFEGRVEVDRFDRQGGFWFPARGHGSLTTKSPEGTFNSEHEFAIDQIRFNEAIPASRFEMPTPTAGAEIVDASTRSIRIQGGRFAREELKRRFPPPGQPKPDAPTIQVPPTISQAGAWLSTALIAVGLLTGLVAIGATLRRGLNRA